MPKRTDANQSSIVRALREIGASVQSIADLGKGVPDIMVGFQGYNYLFEVKDWKQPPSKRRLTKDEKSWHENWRGSVRVIETFEDALKAMRR